MRAMTAMWIVAALAVGAGSFALYDSIRSTDELDAAKKEMKDAERRRTASTRIYPR